MESEFTTERWGTYGPFIKDEATSSRLDAWKERSEFRFALHTSQWACLYERSTRKLVQATALGGFVPQEAEHLVYLPAGASMEELVNAALDRWRELHGE